MVSLLLKIRGYPGHDSRWGSPFYPGRIQGDPTAQTPAVPGQGEGPTGTQGPSALRAKGCHGPGA